MKRKHTLTIAFVILYLCLFCTTIYGMTVFRQHSPDVGKPSGKYYTTDIRAFVNGKEINAYNIGGRTLVCIEDLKDYGFSVYWEDRSQVIEANIKKPYPVYVGNKDYGKSTKTIVSGNIAGTYYVTDVRSFVNGRLLDSYNIGGRTLICIEDLSHCDFEVYWNGVNRTISAIFKEKIRIYDYSDAEGLYSDVVVNPMLIQTVPSLPGNLEGEAVQSAGDRGIKFTFQTDLNLDEDEIYKIACKDYFPVIDENGNDLSDDFTYYYTSAGSDNGRNFYIIWISIKPSVLMDYFSDDNMYEHRVKVYMPGEISKDMKIQFNYYFETILEYGNIWVLHDSYGFYYY